MKLAILIGIGLVVISVVITLIVLIVKKSSSKYEILEFEEDEMPIKNKNKSKNKNKNKNKSEKRKKGEKVYQNTSGLIYYEEYELSFQEKLIYSALGIAVLFTAGYIIYGSVLWAAAFSLIGLKYPKIKRKSIIKARKKELLLEFKEALYVIAASLGAGKSVTVAFQSAYDDLSLMFGHKKKSYILNELLYINRRIQMNETIEDALMDFAKRSNLEDVRMFAEIFYTCNRLGGNLKTVIGSTSSMMNDKITISQDIDTLVSGKKFEAKMLTVIPFGIVLFIKFSAPEFMKGMDSVIGKAVGTVALLLIIIATFISNKITNIEV